MPSILLLQLWWEAAAALWEVDMAVDCALEEEEESDSVLEVGVAAVTQAVLASATAWEGVDLAPGEDSALGRDLAPEGQDSALWAEGAIQWWWGLAPS